MARWPTQGVVTAAEPGRRFGFDIHFGPIPVAHWEYVMRPGDTGCTLTEWWTDRRPAALRLVADRAFGSRHAINTRGIAKTLANIKQTAESP